MRFAGPVLVDELAELVDKGKEGLNIQHLDTTAGVYVFDIEYVVNFRLGNKHKQLGNIGGIDLTGVRRCSAHTNQLQRPRKPPGSGKNAHNKRSRLPLVPG